MRSLVTREVMRADELIVPSSVAGWLKSGTIVEGAGAVSPPA